MDWTKVLMTAIAAVGLIQYLKGFVKDKIPSWGYGVALPVVCVGCAAVMFLLPLWIGVGLLALTIAQLGYETLIQVVKKYVGM